jgi:hypothetical protein
MTSARKKRNTNSRGVPPESCRSVARRTRCKRR